MTKDDAIAALIGDTEFLALFWSKVEKGDDCWVWRGARTGEDYGLISGMGQTVGAHRVAWAIAHGPIPKGMCICHHCDNPPCVRDDHLFLGTSQDNTRDMWLKGGSRGGRLPGEKNGRAKITRAQVEEIRALHGKLSGPKIAARYGIGRSQVYDILHHKRWK